MARICSCKHFPSIEPLILLANYIKGLCFPNQQPVRPLPLYGMFAHSLEHLWYMHMLNFGALGSHIAERHVLHFLFLRAESTMWPSMDNVDVHTENSTLKVWTMALATLMVVLMSLMLEMFASTVTTNTPLK